MIKILKYEEYEDDGDRVLIHLLYPDNTVGITDVVLRSRDQALADAYIITKNNRKAYTGEIPEGLEELQLNRTPVKIVVNDWYNLDGTVYDQYGDAVDIPIEWSIEGAGATIVDGKVITEDVETETSFFIVANAGELEIRKERTVYPIVEDERDRELRELRELVDTLIGGDAE